jgi:hypothetical protein
MGTGAIRQGQRAHEHGESSQLGDRNQHDGANHPGIGYASLRALTSKPHRIVHPATAAIHRTLARGYARGGQETHPGCCSVGV